MGTGLLVMSHLAMAADWQDSQEITEYFIDGNDDGERLFVAFEHAPNPEGCGSDAKYTHVDGATKKCKYLFFIILSVHGAKQSVAPKLEACDEPGRSILMGLKMDSN